MRHANERKQAATTVDSPNLGRPPPDKGWLSFWCSFRQPPKLYCRKRTHTVVQVEPEFTTDIAEGAKGSHIEVSKGGHGPFSRVSVQTKQPGRLVIGWKMFAWDTARKSHHLQGPPV